MSRVRSTLGRVPLPLALLLGVALVLSLSWSLATAPLQGPDETDHLAYVEHLATTVHIPSPTTGNGAYATDEAAALDLGFIRTLQNPLVRPPWGDAALERWRVTEEQLTAADRKTGDGPSSVGKNPPLFYALGATVDRLAFGAGFFGRLFALRALNGLLLLVTVAFTWLLAGELFGRRMLPRTVATAVVALLPMNGFMSAVVNTDMLLATIWAAFLWLALRMVRLGLTWQRAAVLASVSVLSVLTHGRGLAMVPALAAVLAIAWLVHRRTLRATLPAIAGSGAVLTVGFVIYRLVTSAAGAGGSLYGGEVNLGQKGTFSIGGLLSTTWEFYLPRLPGMVHRLGPPIGYREIFVNEYFAGVFASLEVAFPPWVYDTVRLLIAALVVLGLTVMALNGRTVRIHWAKIAVVAATAASMLALLHLASYRALANGSENPLLVGRYLIPLTPVVGTAIAGIVALLPRRAGVVLAVALLMGMLALSLGGIGLSAGRFYA